KTRGTLSGAALTIMNGNTNYIQGNTVIGNATTADTKFEVVGTISGAIIYGNNSVNSSGSITAEGAVCGSTLFAGTSIKGAGLTSCNNQTSALQWSSTTGRFSCTTLSGAM